MSTTVPGKYDHLIDIFSPQQIQDLIEDDLREAKLDRENAEWNRGNPSAHELKDGFQGRITGTLK